MYVVSGDHFIRKDDTGRVMVDTREEGDDFEMPPPNNKSGAVNLTPEEIGVLKTWIDQGAKNN